MTAPQPLSVHGPEDILAFIPHSLGYWPSSSVVAMTLHGKRLGATLRLDLPGPAGLRRPEAFARAVRGYLQADGDADGTLVAVFGGTAAAPAPQLHQLLMLELYDALQRAGMPVRDAWYVGDRYWRGAFCVDSSCCPAPGRPVQQILDSRLYAEMVFQGSTVGPPPDGSPIGDQWAADYLAAVRAARTAWRRKLERRRGSREQFHLVLSYWAAVLGRPAGEPLLPAADRDGFLLATLMVPCLRDAVLVQAAAGRTTAVAGAAQFGLLRDGPFPRPLSPLPAGDLPGRQPGGDAGSGSGSGSGTGVGTSAGQVFGYGDVLLGLGPEVPDWPQLEALDRMLAHLALAGGKSAAAPLTLQGWVAWCRGRGSVAAAYYCRALRAQPQYRLAGLLLELDQRGTICGWAARKEAAWQKFSTDPERGTGQLG
ncbi:DUF4192 domain-containing protein [Arthrobacter sp. G.S.26]|uniref:DUF4192 domain-containing protein n=1 Tax=Micrococcaceae TaxID=1268 RepID=UPI00255382F0|nr:DUF4192 domain-containing protein [Pseudarthrobacter sp. MEB009]